MSYCPYCGSPISGSVSFCGKCGMPLQPSESSNLINPSRSMKKKSNKSILIIVTAVIAVAIAASAVVVSFLQNDRHESESFEHEMGLSTTVPTALSESSAPEKESSVAPATQTSTKENSTDAATTRAISTNNWNNAPEDRLYRPEASYFIDQYTAYVFCTDVNVQDYAKMRFGPSKTHFNLVGVIVPNYEPVTVQTKNLDGWTLCVYNGTEGWIRSDFLFSTKESIPGYFESKQDKQYACGGEYIVSVTGQYQGEPLNMRAKPSKESRLITTVPNGAWVRIEDNTPIINGWVWVFYQEPNTLVSNSGYVLYKYLVLAEDAGDKPILYLYPENPQKVRVKIDLSNCVRFNCTYPKYKDGWTVLANPDGTLINLADGKEYSYLFWDITGKVDYDFSSGFVVKGEDTSLFLQKTLAEIGLTSREANEFIVYWLPKMEKNQYNLISFQSTEYINNVKLNIQPEPDSIIRVFMAYKKLDKTINIPPQTIQPFDRKGFVAVEWGGVEVVDDID